MGQLFCLYSQAKKAYITVDERTKLTATTTDRDKARRFETCEGARNFLKFNVDRYLGNFSVVVIDTPKKKEPQKTKTTRDGLGKTAYNKIVTESDLKDILDRLAEQQATYDMQLSDLYHFAGDNPKLPANKGYKLYKKLVDIVQQRAVVKIQTAAIYEALKKERMPYKPRTNIYEELEKL